jgi:hypothetical protein
MKTWITLLVALFSAGCGWIDLSTDHQRDLPIAPNERGAVSMVIQVDESAQQAQLQIPRKMLADLRADAGVPTQTETMVAGLSLAVGLACGGLWLVRHHGTVCAKLLTGVIAAMIVSGTAVWADLAPPGGWKGKPPPRPTPFGLVDRETGQIVGPLPTQVPLKSVNGPVVINLVETGSEIKLILTREQLAKLNAVQLPSGN